MRIPMTKVSFTLAALCLLSGNVLSKANVTFDKDGGRYREKVERTGKVTPGGSLRLSTSSSGVTVKSWNRSEFKVVLTKRADVFTENEARAAFKDIHLDVENEDNEVTVDIFSSTERQHRALKLSIEVTIPTKFNVDARTSGGSLKIGDQEGNVALKTAGGGITTGQVKNGEARLETSGGSIRVAGMMGGNLDAHTAGGGITVGNATGDVKVRTSGGTIKIGEVGGSTHAETAGGGIRIVSSANDVWASTAGGSINIGQTKGKIEARTAGGQIKIGPAGGEIRAETSGGGITVRGSGGPVKVRTAGGSIRVNDARGAISAETAGGSIRASLVVSDPKIDTECELTTNGGDVTIYLPEDLSATVSAVLRISRRRDENYKIISDFPLKIQEDRTHRITADGDINGGGDEIRLSTHNGNIRILKLGSEETSK
jgi:DUF4097 and DUF4098 domain-containing protein YvlB